MAAIAHAQPAAAAAMPQVVLTAAAAAKEQEEYVKRLWTLIFHDRQLVQYLGLQALNTLRKSVLAPYSDHPPSIKELEAGAVWGFDSDSLPFIAVCCIPVKDCQGNILPQPQKVELVYCRVHRPVTCSLQKLKGQKDWSYQDYNWIVQNPYGKKGPLDFLEGESVDKLRRLIMGEAVKCFGDLCRYYKKVD